MDDNADEVQKWGFGLQELYRLALTFYKQNSGKAIHLSYEDNLKLIAFKQQASLGPFDPRHAPELGVLDVIGKDRRLYWQTLGAMSRVQAMEGFIDFLDTMCSSFRPYIEAVRKNRDEILKTDLKSMEAEKLLREQQKSQQQELLEEGYKEELQRRQLQDALNKQTYQQFKNYAEKQFPGVPEQQAVLIHQLQQEHYHQYMQQFIYQNSQSTKNTHNNNSETAGNDDTLSSSSLTHEDKMKILTDASENIKHGNEQTDGEEDDEQRQQRHQQKKQTNKVDDSIDEDFPLINPAKIWTRPDIQDFKSEVSAGDGDGVITISHGDSITVRVPTNINGKCIFWEFATDTYDIGFGIYFEWSKPMSNEVTVIVSETDEDDDYGDDDYLSTTDDLECGSGINENNAIVAPKPPISIIVPIYRRECYNEVYVGSHTYPGEGVYLLKFDNSYSIWRSKTLYYRVYYER